MMGDDLSQKALQARRAVMALCQAVERQELKKASHGPSAGDAIAVRDQLIEDLIEVLGDICHANGSSPDLDELLAKARHVLDNVRDALPKAGE